MHAVCEIVIPPTGDVKSMVTSILEPFNEQPKNDDDRSHSAFWDFWVIGGRFSGNKLAARLDPDKLKQFHSELQRRKVMVSGLVCGKEELQPASQIPMVDALWREMFPGTTEKCPIFKHGSVNQYGKDGIDPTDICTVEQLPDSLTCERLIVAAAGWNGKTHDDWTKPRASRMLQTEFWNGVEHLDTTFDGKVKGALSAMATDERKHRRLVVPQDWRVVTVDYHS